MTLIEVMASIAILGSLLSAVVVAAARHTNQVRRAQDRIAACDVADRLLQTWVVENRGLIPETSGLVEDRPDWRWRVSGRRAPAVDPFGCHVGVLEISTEPPGGVRAVLASVEFVSSAAATAGMERQP